MHIEYRGSEVKMEKYKNSHLAVEERVEDLLRRMTLKEKVGQLNQKMFGWKAYLKTNNTYELTEEFKDQISFGDGMGALYGLFRADPWSGVTYGNGIALKDCAKVANMLQRYVIENTRLGIPVLISEECPHGQQALDGTVFPVNLGIGSTWNPVLYEEAYKYVAAEIRARGGNLGLVSTLDILQDPRWGRAEECFGEDPYHASLFTASAVRGLQGNTTDDLQQTNKIGAVLKHFCAQGACVGGHNQGSSSIGERELREIHLPGMLAGVKAGAAACMAAYNEIDGIPCHINTKILTDILREEWDFKGFVMADGTAVDRLLKLVKSHEEAAALAISAGVDLSLWDTAFTCLEKSVEAGLVLEEIIDRAVRRVLRIKFMLGLFDKPYTDETLAVHVIGKEKAREVNLLLARESVVLLKNKEGILPLRSNIKRIAVIGPNADHLYNQLGDYTAPQLEGTGATVLRGIQALAGDGTEILYSKGCGIRDTWKSGFEEAIGITQKSDVVVLVLGSSSTRDFNVKFDVTGAAIVSDNPSEMDCGEGVDIAEIELGGVQVDLAKEIIATGVPVITVLIQGRPHAIPWITEHCNAILCGWYPGKEGGTAIAEILFGITNPSGKLSVSIPRSSAQLPVFYNSKDKNDYLDIKSTPLYPFGYGLSYTEFLYSNLKLLCSEISALDIENGREVNVSLDIENIGTLTGAEVVQLYIKDMEASIVRRVKELKGFKKIKLKPGEKKTVEFILGKEELGIWNRNMEFVVEPGNVEIMVGRNSDDFLSAMLNLCK